MNKTNRSGLILLILMIILNVIGLVILFISKNNLINCESNISPNCPTFSCQAPDSTLSYSPFRCVSYTQLSSTCNIQYMQLPPQVTGI
jgi:hypothetical protein